MKIDINIPPEEACPLLGKKLLNRDLELSIDESISLLQTCIAYGNARAESMRGKDAIIIIGSTGAGKSTFVNYLCGCTMEAKDPDDIGIDSMDAADSVVVVKPVSAGGVLDEVMAIGHDCTSKTFMPQIFTAGNNMTYCDCPGFVDNRGAEINIANAVNIRNALNQANSIRLILLIDYDSLKATRSRGLTEIVNICNNLFGDADTFLNFQHHILFGVTKVPSSVMFNKVQKFIGRIGSGRGSNDTLMSGLSSRLFLFDPLDRELDGGLKRDELLCKLKELPSIFDASSVLKTVLLSSDEVKLSKISEVIMDHVTSSLSANAFVTAASYLIQLRSFQVIQHEYVTRLLHHAEVHVISVLRQKSDSVKQSCVNNDFDDIGESMIAMGEASVAFRSFPSIVSEGLQIDNLRNFYKMCKAQAEVYIQRDREYNAKLQEMEKKSEETIALLNKQKSIMEQQLKDMNDKYDALAVELKESKAKTDQLYVKIKEDLSSEMESRLALKSKELQSAMESNMHDRIREIKEDANTIKREYGFKLQSAESEKQRIQEEQDKRIQNTEVEANKRAATLQQKIKEVSKEAEVLKNASSAVTAAAAVSMVRVYKCINEKINS